MEKQGGKMLRTALIVSLLSVCVAVGSSPTQAQSAYLDAEERFYIEWQYTDTNITIAARVNTTGWFGIGFSSNGGMAGADIITASVVNGKPNLQDRYSEKNGYPVEDKSQDVELLSGSEVDGVTTIRFTRKHNTCDDKDMIVGIDTMRVIYAISPDGSDQISYHTADYRGAKSVYLRRKVVENPGIPEDAVAVDLNVDDVEIDAHHTMYHCQLKRAPKFNTKHHLIKVEPLIQKENLGLVHHAVIYGCYDSVDREHHFDNNKTGFDCLVHSNMPPDIYRCRTVIVVWGVGGGPTYFPDEAGYPFGEENSPDYLVMEMHYDNPKLISGRRDNSGFRLTLTPTLRKYDSGILSVGAVHGLAIPPKVKDFTSSGFCAHTCTQRSLKTDLNIFGSFLHAHLSTTQVIARHFRNGKELDIIDEDRHYDFNYQQYKALDTPVVMKAGDEMLVQCHHNTEDRVDMTFGGLPSTSEMCTVFLSYYPATDLDFCFSIPGWVGALNGSNTRDFFKNNLQFKGKLTSNYFKYAFTQLTEANLWTKKRVKSLEQGYKDVPHTEFCMARDFAPNPQYSSKMYMPPAQSKNPPAKREYEKCPSKATNRPDTVVG